MPSDNFHPNIELPPNLFFRIEVMLGCGIMTLCQERPFWLAKNLDSIWLHDLSDEGLHESAEYLWHHYLQEKEEVARLEKIKGDYLPPL